MLAYRNRPGGFWVAATAPEAAHHALTGQVDLPTSALLVSDGAARVVDRFGLATWEDVTRLVAASGVHALIEANAKRNDQTPADAAGQGARSTTTAPPCCAQGGPVRHSPEQPDGGCCGESVPSATPATGPQRRRGSAGISGIAVAIRANSPSKERQDQYKTGTRRAARRSRLAVESALTVSS